MSTTEQINALRQQLSACRIAADPMEHVGTLPQTVKITGALVECLASKLVLEIGQVQLEVPIESIISIQENPSKPAIPQDIAYVDVQIESSAKVIERYARTAGAYGDGLGKRPFVYELPSHASEFSVSEEEFHMHQRQWLDRVGLTEFHTVIAARQTSSQTADDTRHNTITQTSRWTNSSTFTPRDTKTDGQFDHTTDNQTDHRTDFKADFRFDP